MGQIKVELQDIMGNDRTIAETAWTSNLAEQKKAGRSDEDVDRVVRFCAKSGHGTPFESIIFRFWLRIPIFIDRQHMTHRIASHNGMSGRYRTMPEDFYLVPQDVITIMSKSDPMWTKVVTQRYEDLCTVNNKFYRECLSKMKDAQIANKVTNDEYKRCREVLRGILPQGNMTERITTMNLRSFCNYQKLRNHPHAQPEIQEVAKQMLDAVKKSGVCPIAIEELESNGWQI